MSTTPPEYTSAIIANSSIVALINDNVIRPLNDLVAAHGQGIQRHQLIRIDGDVMAVAFMANAQHLIYREDVLAGLGIAVPTTYEEVLAAAETIRAAGVMQNPLGGAYQAGWNLAQEFVNMYIGHGGAFFVPGALGVQEAGSALIGVSFGLGPETGLALSLVKRVRELLLGIPGLLVWQLGTGLRLLGRTRASASAAPTPERDRVRR